MGPNRRLNRLGDDELRQRAREALEVKLPTDLAQQVLFRARQRRVPAWWQAAAATAAFVGLTALLVGTAPEPKGPHPSGADSELVVRLEPAPDASRDRVRYTVLAGGRVADRGLVQLTNYAMDTVSVDAITPVRY
jgi:hypothetical protein